MAAVTLKKLAQTRKIDRFVIEQTADLIASYHLSCAISSKLNGLAADQDTELPAFFADRQKAGCFRIINTEVALENIECGGNQPQLLDTAVIRDDVTQKDVVCDLSRLCLELQSYGLQAEENILFNRYFDVTGGVANAPETLTALRYYMGQLSGQRSANPMMVAIGGLSGGGKSRMSRELAPLFDNRPGARIVRTDVVRKRMMGVGLSERLGSHGYTPEKDSQTYARFCDELSISLKQGHSVIADAVFANQTQREAVEQLADHLNVPFIGLWVTAPADVRASRVATRKNNVSDVTAGVIQRQLEYDLGIIRWHQVDSSGPKAETVKTGRSIVGL